MNFLSAIVIGILNALIGLIMQILSAALEFFADTFLTTVTWDFETFGQYIPFFANFLSFFRVIAAAWLTIVGTLFILKCFGLAAGLQISRSRIWQFILRYMFFGALAINSWGFMSYIYLSLVSVLDDIMAIDASGDLKISSFLMDLGVRVAEGLFTGATGAAGAMVGIVKVLVMLVIAVMLVVNFFNLIKVFFIRYIRLVFLVALAPIAFGMAILEETKDIYNTYIRTFIADMFVFLMTALFIKGFISVMSSSTNRDFDGSVEFADIAYGDLIWAFFAMAYSTFAVQFDQFLAGLGVNVSRGGSSGGGFLGAMGAASLLLRQSIGRGSSSGGGIGSTIGSTFSQNWNGLKSSVLSGARGGFAKGQTPADAMMKGAMGAAKGFADSTNIAKAAAMTRDGSLTAAALNERFAEMQAAAGHDMSLKDYDATKKRAADNNLSFDQQRQRDAILADMRNGNITPKMAQSKLAANGLLTEDEMQGNNWSNDVGMSADGAAANSKNENMAEQFKAAGNTADKPNIGPDGAINTKDGLNINPNESLHMGDGTAFKGGVKTMADGTQIMPDGSMKFANGAVMDKNLRDANGNTMPPGTMLHPDGTMTSGNKIYSPDGSVKQVTEPTTLSDGTTVQPNGARVLGDGDNQVVIGSKGSVSHANGAVTKNGITTHADGSQSFSDGSVRTSDDEIIHIDGSTTKSDGTTVTAEGAAIFSDGSVLHDNGDITSNGVTTHTDQSTSYPDRVEFGNGSIAYNDGRGSNPDGTVIDGMGNISTDGTNFHPIQEPYAHPNGDISYPNGSVYHAASGVTTNVDGEIGHTVHQGGIDSFADGSVFWGNGSSVNPDKTVEFDSGVTVKDGVISHSSGTKTFVEKNITKIIRNDGYHELREKPTGDGSQKSRPKRTIFTGRKR